MSTAIEIAIEDLTDSILPSQYNDLIGPRSPTAGGEYRLLWAVLENAIRTYLANRACANPIQRERFEEVRSWFESRRAEPRALFDFASVCDLLRIDPSQLLNGLKSPSAGQFPSRSRAVRDAGPRSLAA